MSTEKASSGEQSTETKRQGTAGTMSELSTQNETGGTAGQTGSGTGTAGQSMPTASAGSSMASSLGKRILLSEWKLFVTMSFLSV